MAGTSNIHCQTEMTFDQFATTKRFVAKLSLGKVKSCHQFENSMCNNHHAGSFTHQQCCSR